MKRLIKLMSIALCLSIALSASLTSVYSLSLNGVSLGSGVSDNKNADTATDSDAALYKDETVYVMAKANGTVDKIIVSDWIKNNSHLKNITDVATLNDIENVKSNAAYTLNSDNMRVWNVNGEDLYLKGNGTSALPVDLGVTYMLDGKVVSPEEIIGKSGKVTIRFNYTNNQYETVKIDGKKERIYVPFLMMTGLYLDSEKFSNVSVTNGKVVSDGDRFIVAGIAFPGVQQDLKLTKEQIDIPDYVEITAETTGFELGNTVTIATNGLLNGLDSSKLNKLDSIKKSLAKLTDAMTALIDGSSQLYTGLQTLLEKSGALIDGVDQLYAGAQALESGAEKVDAGAGELSTGAKNLDLGMATVNTGAMDLSDGLETLDENSEALNNGSDQTFDSILATAQKSLSEAGLDVPKLTADNYGKVLDDLKDSITEEKVRKKAEETAKQQVTAAVEAKRDTIKAAVTAAVKESVTAKVKEGVRDKVTSAVEDKRETIKAAVTAAVKETVTAKVEASVREKVTETIEGNKDTISEAVTAAVKEAVTTQVEETVRDKVTEQVITGLGYSVEEYEAGVSDGTIDEATQAQVNSTIDQQMESDDVQENIKTLVDQQMQSDDVKSTIEENTQTKINELIEEQMKSDDVQENINTLVDQQMKSDTVQATIDENTQTKIDETIEEQMKSDEVQSNISSLIDQNMKSDAVQTTIAEKTQSKIDELIAENMKSKKVTSAISKAVSDAAAGRQSIAKLKKQLDSYSKFNTGLKTYTKGVGTASGGASQIYLGIVQLKGGSSALKKGAENLKGGTLQLSSGATALKDGIFSMKDGVPALVDGISQLKDGSMKLSNGLKEFNQKGISKITKLFDGNLSKLAPRLKAMIDVSKHYKSYSGLTDEMDGEVKFIYKTEELK